MRSTGFELSYTRRTTVLLAVALFAAAQSASAQVGLSSGTQRISLVARVPAHASLREMVPFRVEASGSVQEASVRVRLAANTGSRLVVRAAQLSGARLWVRAADGQFHELVSDAPITVARHAGHEEWEQEVHYRVESEDAHQPPPSLPVRYEVVIDPAL